MNSFAIDDRVQLKDTGFGRKRGALATVIGAGAALVTVRFDGEAGDSPDRWAEWLFERHVDSFPIAADKDPWAKSEPCYVGDWVRDFAGFCRATHPSGRWACTRARLHNGRCISRYADGTVNARWPQEAPKPAEKPGPVVGMELVATRFKLAWRNIDAGERGTVRSLIGDGRFCLDIGDAGYWLAASDFGDLFIPAADWDAQRKRDTTPCPADRPLFDKPLMNDEVVYLGRTEGALYYGLHGHVRFVTTDGNYDVEWGPNVGNRFYEAHTFGTGVKLVSRTTWESCDTTPCSAPVLIGESIRISKVDARHATLDGDVVGPLFSDRLVSRYARALFDLDFDEHAIRVGDDGGGIGKTAALDRMWARLSDEARATYEWRAAVVLKRAGELS